MPAPRGARAFHGARPPGARVPAHRTGLRRSAALAASAPSRFPGGDGPTCSPHEAHRLVTMAPKGGGYLWLDVRPRADYEAAHLTKVTAASGRVNGWAFARNVPWPCRASDAAFAAAVRASLPELGRGVVVVDQGDGGDARAASLALVRLGYARVTALEGGWSAWLARFDATGRFRGSWVA